MHGVLWSFLVEMAEDAVNSVLMGVSGCSVFDEAGGGYMRMGVRLTIDVPLFIPSARMSRG